MNVAVVAVKPDIKRYKYIYINIYNIGKWAATWQHEPLKTLLDLRLFSVAVRQHIFGQFQTNQQMSIKEQL